MRLHRSDFSTWRSGVIQLARNLFKGAPELSRLFAEAPSSLIVAFATEARFSEVLGDRGLTSEDVKDPDAAQAAVTATLKALGDDRIKLIETEARRITALSDPVADTLLRRLAGDPLFRAPEDLAAQRDAIARSLLAYLKAGSLFDAAERAMQVRVFREHGKLYEAWAVDASVPLAASDVDSDALATEIAEKLQHEEGCKVEAVDLPSVGVADEPEMLLAVTFFGAFASQRTVRPDKSTEIFYYRPPDELLLVYSRARRRIEVCARDATERRLVANVFAQGALKHDISAKPLTQKTFDLGRFRSSLALPIPEEEAHRVRRACVVEVQVALGDWARRVSLSVAPEDDIDAIARGVFGAIIPRSGGGYITRVSFHIEHVDGRGRSATLKFNVLGKNKSTIQNERDPAKRALGYDLLEAWGVMARVGDMPLAERIERLPQLLALYDLPDAEASGRLLGELGIEPDALVRAGFLKRSGMSDVVLFDDEDLGPVLQNVGDTAPHGQVELGLREGGSGQRISVEDVEIYEVRFDYIRDALRDVLRPIGLQGRVREIAGHLHQLGTARIGEIDAPIFLARALGDDRNLGMADQLLRGEARRVRGVVLTPQTARFPFIGPHLVASISDLQRPEDDQIDIDALRITYDSGLDLAGQGSPPHLSKYGAASAQVSVPGQDPLIVTGEKRVRVFERLFAAHRDREPSVKLAELKRYAGFSALPQLFGPEWPVVKNTYIHSPRHGYWALCVEPISV